MATLKNLRIELGWSSARLAREAGVHFDSVKKAESGKTIQAHVAKALADALSKGYGRDIRVLEIEGLSIQ